VVMTTAVRGTWPRQCRPMAGAASSSIIDAVLNRPVGSTGATAGVPFPPVPAPAPGAGAATAPLVAVAEVAVALAALLVSCVEKTVPCWGTPLTARRPGPPSFASGNANVSMKSTCRKWRRE